MAFEMNEILYALSIISGLIYCFLVYKKRNNAFKDIYSLPALPKLPILGNALPFLFVKDSADILITFHGMIDKFSSAFHFTLGWILFYVTVDPSEWEVILNNPSANQKLQVYKFLRTDGIFVSDAPKWKKMRKILNPTFHQSILNSFVQVFSEEGEAMVLNLKQFDGKGNFDMLPLAFEHTTRFVCETAMGLTSDIKEVSKDFGILSSQFMESAFLRMFNVIYHFDFIYKLTSTAKEEDKIFEKINELTRKVVRQKKLENEKRKLAKTSDNIKIEDAPERKAFLDLLMEMSGKNELTETEVLDEAITFMIAGSDATAIEICFTLIMLGMHPEIQDKVYEEVLGIIGDTRPIEYSELNKLQYLEMVVKETLRLFPPAPLIGRTLLDDIKLENRTLPSGLNVIIPILHIHRNARFWPNPLKFDPERFNPTNEIKHHPYASIPFSAGARNCIGLKYGMMSVVTMVATIIRRYEVTTSYKSVEEIELAAHLVLKTKYGFKCAFKLRK